MERNCQGTGYLHSSPSVFLRLCQLLGQLRAITSVFLGSLCHAAFLYPSGTG